MVLVGENRRYLSGFTGEDTQFDESAGALFITDSRAILATDFRFVLQAEEEAPLFEIICYQKGLVDEMPAIVRKLGINTLGIEGVRLSFKLYEQIAERFRTQDLHVEFIEAGTAVEEIRIKKSEAEIQAVQKALVLAEHAGMRATQEMKPGMTEKQIAWRLEKYMREAGAEALSFSTIVASGPNSAMPHAVPGDRQIQKGEPVLFDWGARLQGYCSDISRTFCIGEPDSEYQTVYQTVWDAQRMATDAVKPGIPARDVDAVARDYIDRKGFGGRFGHSLGHGVGLAIHENPRISVSNETRLEPGMLFTVEPGIYIPGWGGVRLENMVVVREHGAEVLNNMDLNWRTPGNK